MRDLNLCSFYRPPSSDIEYLEKLNTFLNRTDSSNPIIWVAGDFNLPHLDWESDSVAKNAIIELFTDNFKILAIVISYSKW